MDSRAIENLAKALLWGVALLAVYSTLSFVFHYGRSGHLKSIIIAFELCFIACHMVLRLGGVRALGFASATLLVSWMAEHYGVATGLIFGAYSYSDDMLPKIMDNVPYQVIVTWSAMIYLCYVIADRVADRFAVVGGARLITVAGLTGVVMTSWDIALDPWMTWRGYWIWHEEGVYFGIPLQNFIGWWLTVSVTVAVYLMACRCKQRPQNRSLDEMAVVNYFFGAIGTIVLDMQAGLTMAAVAGAMAMTPWLLLSYASLRRNRQNNQVREIS